MVEYCVYDVSPTYGSSDSYHLQMSALEFAGQWGICGILRSALDIEDLSIGAQAPFWRYVHVGISFEAVQHPPPDTVSMRRGLAILGGLRVSAEALLCAVPIHLVAL